MKYIKFILSLLLTLGLVYFLSNPFTIKGEEEKTLPPLGSFFSPFTGFWQNAESSVNAVFQSFEIPEMKGKVTVHFDERMVPHIFAENMEDAVFAQGYIEAGMRLWQMDLLTRVGSGRLAEVMGENLLATDQLMRRRGMLYAAQNSEKAWRKSPETMRILSAYERGINKWVDELQPKDYPIEFKLLNYKPERWSILKTALIRQYMNLTLNLRESDVEATNALQVFGEENFKKLFPEKNPKQTPIIPPGTKWDFEPIKIEKKKANEDAIGLIPNHLEKVSSELVGSNNWAVAGSKTLSGKPILCNDPHLQLSLPSIWFEVQINVPESNVYGVSIPGLPGVIIGFNENIAWGVTNVGTDVADWYKIEWTDQEKTTYSLDGQIKKADLVVETYKIKGAENPVFDTVKWTYWGPVVYDSKESGWKDLALRWISHDEPLPDDISTFTGLDMGKNYDDYRNALKRYAFPAQNFVFASNEGDIAITVNGRFPLKYQGQGPFVQNGNSTENEWPGFIPMEQVPTVKNPPQAYVASANQRSTDDTYPYYYNSAGFDDYRGRVLNDALSQMDSIKAEDMMDLQLFDYSIHAAEALPLMIDNLDEKLLSDREMMILGKMKKWGFSFDKDQVEPAIFQVWWNKYYESVFDEIMVFKDSLPMLKPDQWRLVEMTEKTPTDPFFDLKATPATETAKEISMLSFQATCADLADDLLKPNFDWSSYKKTSIMHLTRIPAFSRMNLDVGGYRQALNAISENHGPSWRMVVELGEDVKAWGVFPGGQSGNPGSPYYDLDVDTWRTGSYNQLFFMKDGYDTCQKVKYSITIN
ncbi:MAG: penicillin acylase family protein [Saprospiraceae bacterium]